MTEQSQKRPITVTHIISGDLWAGAEVQVYNLCKALNGSDEVAVTAVVFNPGILYDKLVGLGIPVTLADESSTGPLGIARRIAAHCRSQATDIVHTHGFKENILGILGKELARVRYSVRTVHGNPEHKFSWKKPHKWLVAQLDSALGHTRQQAIIAVSSQLEAKLNSLFPGKVTKIFNFIDIDEIQQHRESPNLNSDRQSLKRIGIAGRLVPVKRVDLFIKAIAQLQSKKISCAGIIIGSGPLEQRLRDLAEDLAISDRIEFKGFVNPATEELRKLDILVMPSDHEGLPMVALEALALKIPIIAHKVGGIPEVLLNGDCGWLVSEHTGQGYASYIEHILKNYSRSECIEKVNRGLVHARKTFDAAENSKLYIDLYLSLHHKISKY